ncbi:MAG: prepilin-type N-terminal cleavage/methylation domain-containing protein [Capsulimonadales bacterium]|nr:prepilin-type N-terminal cleavage/methylation domain-containing protein [Capsulimonadales bacterium]
MARKYTPHVPSRSAKQGRTAFTLIEIMIVVLVIGVLLSIATPNFVRARQKSRRNACIANLMQIRAAKQQWALEMRRPGTATPTDADLFGDALYLRRKPACPSGGTYTLRQVDRNPRCSFFSNPDFPHSIVRLQDDGV